MKNIKTGQELRDARKSLKMSQGDLADVCEVARNTVCNWENLEHLPVMISHGTTSILTALEQSRELMKGGEAS